MNNYEATYILNTQGKDEGAKEIIDAIEAAVKELDGKVTGGQKLDRRRFERVAGKLESGFYAIVNFSLDPAKVATLEEKFNLDDRVYRQHIFLARERPAKKEKAAA